MKIVREMSLFKNIARVLSANFLVAIIGFLGNFIFPKILTIDSYAMYHTFTLYVGYIAILHLGFPSGMVINYAGADYETIDQGQYKSETIIVFGVLSFFTIIFSGAFFITRNNMIGYIAIAILPVCITNSYKGLLQSWAKFKIYSRISTAVATAIPVVALAFYFLSGDLPGNIYIYIYLLVYWLVTFKVVFEAVSKTRTVKCKKILSRINWETEKTGLALVLGNYINTLFLSADKQFVKFFFSTTEFAYYSFGMSMQSLMTVFITSVAQPLFPAMAQGKFKDQDYNKVKDMLIIFGSFSGCAYFVTSFIVNNFIEKYIESLQVVGIYFVVFPAMAVINCLYINLYKIKGMMRTYVITLAGIFSIAIILNLVFVLLMGKFTGVAIATTITYYIWFLGGMKQFKFLKLAVKDIVYLILYTIGFFTITRTMEDITGFIVYFILIFVLAFVCYKNELSVYLHKFMDRN